MRLVYCGTATIDEQLQMRKTDEAFFQFIGQDIYGTVEVFVHEADLERFQTALRAIWKDGASKNMTVVRKRGSEDWYLVDISKETIELEDVTPMRMEVYSIATDDQLSGDGSWRDREVYETFFGMMSGTMLLYDRESGQLDIRAGVAQQMLSLYHGTFDEWSRNYMIQRLDESSKGAFETFCKDMDSGKPNFQHKIVTSAFSDDGEMLPYIFKCCTLTGGSSTRVLGCITAGIERAGGSTEVVDYTMDAGLPILNKRSITDYAKRAFMSSQDNNTYLVIMDLDDFKTVNDTYGHMFGDEVLLKMVEIVKNNLGQMGMLGRIGGDELMLVLTGINSETELRNLLRTIRTNIEWEFQGIREGIHLTCSMGVAAYPANADTYDKVFQLADRMLYIAKNKGKNRYVIYTPEIHDVSSTSEKSDWNQKVNQLKDDKLGVLQRTVEEFLIRRIATLEMEFRELAVCFELDEIVMVYDNGASVTRLIQDQYYNSADEYTYMDYEEGFLEAFDKNNVLAVNGRFNVESNAPALSKILEDKGIESALFYKMMKNSRMFGYIMFAKKSRRQMWSEYEKTMLGVAGKAIELSFLGK